MNDRASDGSGRAQARRRSSTGRTKKGRLRRLLPFLGPAFIASIAYIDPGNFATNIQGGAQFGFMLLWVILASNLIAMLSRPSRPSSASPRARTSPSTAASSFRSWLVMVMWILAEIVAMATDLAEFLGAALGFYLLLGIPLWIGGHPHRRRDLPHPQPRALRLPAAGGGDQRASSASSPSATSWR